jgi:hypothetical protein
VAPNISAESRRFVRRRLRQPKRLGHMGRAEGSGRGKWERGSLEGRAAAGGIPGVAVPQIYRTAWAVLAVGIASLVGSVFDRFTTSLRHWLRAEHQPGIAGRFFIRLGATQAARVTSRVTGRT